MYTSPLEMPDFPAIDAPPYNPSKVPAKPVTEMPVPALSQSATEIPSTPAGDEPTNQSWTDKLKDGANDTWKAISDKFNGIDWESLKQYAPYAAALLAPVAAGAVAGGVMGDGVVRGGLRAAGATAGAFGGGYLGGKLGDMLTSSQMLSGASEDTKKWIKLISMLGGAGLGGVTGYGGARAITGGFGKEASINAAYTRMMQKKADNTGAALAALGLGAASLAPAAGIGALAGSFGDGGAARGALRGAGTAAGIGLGGGLGGALGTYLGDKIGDGSSAAGLGILGALAGGVGGGVLGYKGAKALSKSKKEQLKEAIMERYLRGEGEASITPSIAL